MKNATEKQVFLKISNKIKIRGIKERKRKFREEEKTDI